MTLGGESYGVLRFDYWPGLSRLVMVLTAGDEAVDRQLAGTDFPAQEVQYVVVAGGREVSLADARIKHVQWDAPDGGYLGSVLLHWSIDGLDWSAGEVVELALVRRGPGTDTGTAPPTAPGSLTAEITDGGVALSWQAPARDAGTVTGYAIERAVGEGEFAALVPDTGGTGTSYTDSTATRKGETYAYRVAALRNGGQSRWSDRAEVQVPRDPADLAPSGLTAEWVWSEDYRVTGVALSWEPPAEDSPAVTGYSVRRAVDDGETTVLAANTGTTGTSYADTASIDPQRAYSYQVLAWRDGSLSQPSEGVTLQPAFQVEVVHIQHEYATAASTAAVAGGGNATGRPVVSGTAEVGERLTASVSGISDPDGPPVITGFSYQWIATRNAPTRRALRYVIHGATDATYVVRETDIGSAMSVRVTFTDGADGSEDLLSEDTALVPNPHFLADQSFSSLPVDELSDSVDTADLVDIWTDGVMMWAVDQDNDKVYGYRLSDKKRDSTKEFDLAPAGCCSGHGVPYHLTSDGATMWIDGFVGHDFDDRHVFAYSLVDDHPDLSGTSGEFGARVPARDYDLQDVSGTVKGIAVDERRGVMWVMEGGTASGRIYAYSLYRDESPEDLLQRDISWYRRDQVRYQDIHGVWRSRLVYSASRARLPDQDIDLGAVHSLAPGGSFEGMYIKGDVMWLAHGDTAANGVVAFNVQEGYSMPRRDLHVSSALDFRGITGHEDTIWLMDCPVNPCQVVKAYPRPLGAPTPSDRSLLPLASPSVRDVGRDSAVLVAVIDHVAWPQGRACERCRIRALWVNTATGNGVGTSSTRRDNLHQEGPAIVVPLPGLSPGVTYRVTLAEEIINQIGPAPPDDSPRNLLYRTVLEYVTIPIGRFEFTTLN